MSDPNAWTPPCSPKFLGESSCHFESTADDIFPDFEGDQTLHSIYLVYPVDPPISLTCCADNAECWTDYASPSSLIWSRSLLRMPDVLDVGSSALAHELRVSRVTTKAIRNDMMVLITTVLQQFRVQISDSSAVSAIAHLRAIIINFGCLCSSSLASIHAKIELWIVFLKILEVSRSHEKFSLINLSLGLDCKSALDAYGYFSEIVLENLICMHSTKLRADFCCGCLDGLWALLVRYAEKFQSGWFKYLHGKMMKIISQKPKFIYEPTSLERLRPSTVVYREAGIHGEDGALNQNVWLIYWSLLAHTAPIHKAYMAYVSSSQVSQESLQKYSIVVWLIRKHFLGESVPSEQDMQSALNCLLRLVNIWGPSIEVLRPLWLYFGRELDHGSISLVNFVKDTQVLRFSDWLSMVQRNSTPHSNNYELFCLLARTVRGTQLFELKSILKVSLPSLTRRAIFHYFLLLGHLFDASLMRYTSKDLGNTDSLVTLVDLILEIFSRSISTTPLHNWDAGRQCSALQGLQTLLLLFRHHWLCAKTDRVLLVDGFQRLSELCSSIRTGLFQMLYTDSLPSVANLANRHQRLSSIGWKMDLLNSTFQFGLDMVDWSVGTPPESLLRMLSICFDSMFFQSVRWPNQDSWYTFLTRLLELSSCVGLWNESTNQLQNVLWSTVYPSLKESTSIDSVECSSTPRHVSRALATIALAFVELSCFGSSVKSTDFTTSIPTPLTIIEHFSTSAAVTHALRFAFIESLFSCTGPLERILLSITRDQTTVTDIAWHFTVLRLAYCLLVRPALDDHGSNQLNSSETPLTCTTSWLAYFPPEFSSFLTTDPELALMALTAKFDGFQTFQERMAYKTLLCDRLGPLCSLLCDLCSVSTVAKERGSGLYHCLVPGLQQDALCTIGYRAVSLIVRHCSRLIYSPFTSGSAASSLELFIANFLLPRQLYEWEKSRWSGLDQMPLPTFVIDCMCDRLTDFIVGLAQLPWRSDSYISRVLKDTVKLYHTHLGSECLATAILNSPVTEFRARLLYLAMAESVNELSDDQVTVQKTKHAFTKWLQLCKLIHNGTRSLETHQRDAPYVVAPILLALSTKTSSTDGLRNDCNAIVNEYKQAINEISSVEMKLQLKEDCRTIAQNYKSIPDLHKFFGI